MSFLTVEDVNSSLIKYSDINMFHAIDTKNISLDEFSDVRYDFAIVSHQINAEHHIFKFKIVNKNWGGAYYFIDENDNYIDADADLIDDNTIVLISPDDNVKLVLYCSPLVDEFNFIRLTWRPLSLNSIVISSMESITDKIPILSLTDDDMEGNPYIIGFYDKNYGLVDSITKYVEKSDGEFFISQIANPNANIVSIYLNEATFYYTTFIKKVIPKIEINDYLTVGKINRVELTVPNNFSRLNEFIPNNELPYLKGYIYYDDKTIPLKFDTINNKYYFELDLREKTNNNRVKLSLKILETDYIQGSDYEFNIKSKYVSIENISDLISEMGINGSKIIELSNDFNLVGDITVSHDTIVYGKNHILNLNEHSFIISEGVTLKANKLSFNNGDTAIIQNMNSILELADCSFHKCKSTNYNNIGSCIFCDIDLESLSLDDDFITKLTNCLFIDNHSAILHGGLLTVDNCKFRNTTSDVADMNNPAFLYQVDGDATISNSIFDIDYDSDAFCENNENIGFAQALIMCGQTATVNRATYANLQYDDSLPFFESPYNNKSHLFVKYFYPQINTCVFSSPNFNFEDKSCCHSVSGIDWVFKNNIQITRVNWETENRINKIVWED